MKTLKNTSLRTRILVIAIIAGSTISTSALARQDVVEESFSVSKGGTLYLDIDWGNVEVITGSGNTVSITMERDVDGASSRELEEILEHHEYYLDRDGDDVVVESEFDQDENDRAWRRWKRENHLEIDFYITVPADYNVDFITGAGNVEIDDLYGMIDGRTGAGNVTIGDIEGPVDVSTGAGNIQLKGAEGRIHVHSGAGDIILDDVLGEIDARTGAGNIEATITEDLYGDSSFNTGAGNVIVYLDDTVGADVEARSSLGNAKSDFDLRVRGKWMSKSFSGEVNGGGPEISLSAGVGNVSLRRN